MNQVTIKKKDGTTDDNDPLVWIAVDRFGAKGSSQSVLRELPEPQFSSRKLVSSDSVLELWRRLAGSDPLPAPALRKTDECSALADFSLTFEIIRNGAGPANKLVVRQIGERIADFMGIDASNPRVGGMEGSPFITSLQANLAAVMDSGQPIVLETDYDDLQENEENIECVLMPFGDKKTTTSIVAVLTAAERLPIEHGDDILNLEESLIVEATAYAETDQTAELESDVSSPEADTPAAKTKGRNHSNLPAANLAVSDLISEARSSADKAREAEEASRKAEEASRAASMAALSSSYELALAIARSPEEIAVQLVFGGECSEERMAEYVAMLTRARAEDVDPADLTEFLRS